MDMVLIAFDTQLQSSIEILNLDQKHEYLVNLGPLFLKKMDILARCGISLRTCGPFLRTAFLLSVILSRYYHLDSTKY